MVNYIYLAKDRSLIAFLYVCMYCKCIKILKKVKISFCGVTFASRTLVSWKQTTDHKKIFFFPEYIVIIST